MPELWAREPAEPWTDAYPVGSGRLGAMVHGRPGVELIQVNDDTCWAGHPGHWPGAPDGPDAFAATRAALLRGDLAEAERASLGLQSGRVASYQPLVDLVIERGAEAIDYRRSLDLRDGIARAEWADGRQEVWASHPDGVIVVTGGGTVGLRSSHPAVDGPSSGDLSMIVQMPSRIVREPSPKTDVPVWGGGPAVTALVAVVVEADRVILAVATDFVDGLTRPHGDLARLAAEASARLDAARASTTAELRQRHVDDHRALFDRMTIELPSGRDHLPTVERVQRFAEEPDDPGLAALVVDYGRYLTIAASRPGSRAMNLQGIWNASTTPPWRSNYTTNINLQMNYWLAEPAGLPECVDPLVDLIELLAVTGTRTARQLYEAPGWVVHHNSDVWGFSGASGDGQDDPVWSVWPLGGAWLARHLVERWEFGRDHAELRQRLLPLLRGAAEFLLWWMVRLPDGTWGTAPSTSPENHLLLPDGTVSGVTVSTTADLAMMRDLFSSLSAIETDAAFRARLDDAVARLPRERVDSSGRLAEWHTDGVDAEPQHRHQSHLYGVLPGESVLSWRDPELAAAALASLDARGAVTTGWSLAWRMGLRARLDDAPGAFAALKRFLAPRSPGDSDLPSGPAGVYGNLFCAHPPFQIDGNFGAAAAVLEMIVQSHGGRVRVLPALPAEWPSGRVTGVRLRGGGTIDLAWNEHEIRMTLRDRPGETVLDVEGETAVIHPVDGTWSGTLPRPRPRPATGERMQPGS